MAHCASLILAAACYRAILTIAIRIKALALMPVAGNIKPMKQLKMLRVSSNKNLSFYPLTL